MRTEKCELRKLKGKKKEELSLLEEKVTRMKQFICKRAAEIETKSEIN